MLMGGYVLMAGWAVVFTVALSLEVCIIKLCMTPLPFTTNPQKL